MPEALESVFISATSPDLRSYRDATKAALVTGEVFPRVQENLPPDYRTLVEHLEDQIKRSDAVVCLVGLVFGAAPEQTGDAYRSYTQIEYDVARRLEKPIYVFLATENYVADQSVTEGESETLLQREHRSLLMRNHKCTPFSSPQDLRLRIAELVPIIRRRQMTPSGSFVFLHSPPEPFFFAGRDLELKQLTEALERRRPCLVAVVGIGGQGKTTLAAHWIRERQPFEFEGGLWVTADLGGFTFDAFLEAALSYFLRDKFDKLAFADLSSRVQKLLVLLQERRALLVIDGVERWLHGWKHGRDLGAAETHEQREGDFEGLDEFLSGASGITNGAHVVLTTRAMPAVLDHVECAVVPVREPGAGLALDGLDDEAAVGLLRSLGVHGPPDEIRHAARAYANHPLALTVLGGLLNRSYDGELRPMGDVSALKPEQQLDKLLGETRANLPGRKRSDRFLQIASHCIENPALSTLASVMGRLKFRWRAWPAFVLGKLLHREFAGRQPEISALRELAITIADWQLVEWHGATSTVRIHPIIKEYFASRARDSAAIHRSLAQHYASTRLENDAMANEHMGSRLLAVEHSLRAGDFSRCVELMFQPLTPTYSYSEWLAAWGHLGTGIALLERLSKASKGDARAQFLIARSAMLHQLGKSPQAMEELNEAIRILGRRGAGSEQQRTNLARALANRGNVLRETGRSPDAIPDFDRAINIFRELGSQRASAQLDLAQSLVNRANALCDAGHWSRALADYDSAEALYQSMTDMGEQIVAPRMALVLANRGIVLGDLRRDELAIRDFLKAIALFAELESAGRKELAPRLAHARIMLGSRLDESERSAEALPHLDAARDELQQLLELGRGDAEPILALALMDRGRAHIRLKNWPMALSDCNAAASAYERLMEDGRPQLAGSLAHALLNLAEARYASGDRQGSLDDRSRGFAMLRKLMREWSGEADIRVVYMKRAAATVKYLLPSEAPEALEILTQFLTEVEGFVAPSDAAEALCYTAARELASLEQTGQSREASGFDVEEIRRLQRMAQTRIIARS